MKGILFNTEMVHAIQNGTKTVTRRVVKPHSPKACGFYVTYRKSDGAFMGVYDYDEHERMFDSPQAQPAYPGDILYVRETWQNTGKRYIYKADINGVMDDAAYHALGWRPSIHMPKEAARIFLRVTDVRVDRLQDITEEQASKEGAITFPNLLTGEVLTTARMHFSGIWDSTIKPVDRARYGWDANPWVWVIEFERISKEEALK